VSLETFEALGIIFLFLAPGALFIWLVTMSYSPAARREYLSRQFPLELTLHYLLVSVLIHVVLLTICALIVYAVMTLGKRQNAIQEWYDLLSKPYTLSPQGFLTFALIPLGYLMASFVMAALLAALLKDRLLVPDALWASELMKLLSKDAPVDVEVLGQNGEATKGRLVSFQLVGGSEFELLLAQVRPNQKDVLIWIPSKMIRTLHCETDVKMWAFVFPSKEGRAR
jgi:hypothetical protein